MATTEEVKKLAALARVGVADAELEKFTSEFDAILAYVKQLEELNFSDEKESKPALLNVMRAGGEPDVPGAYTEKIVEQFPASDKNALTVKQIISYD